MMLIQEPEPESEPEPEGVLPNQSSKQRLEDTPLENRIPLHLIDSSHAIGSRSRCAYTSTSVHFCLVFCFISPTHKLTSILPLLRDSSLCDVRTLVPRGGPLRVKSAVGCDILTYLPVRPSCSPSLFVSPLIYLFVVDLIVLPIMCAQLPP